MKILTLIILILPIFSTAQEFKKIITNNDSYYMLFANDSMTIPKAIPNGRWKIFYNNDTSKIKYIFHLNNNKVTGPFNSYYYNGKLAAIGSFKDDSLWTFMQDLWANKDTTFSTGLWSYQLQIDLAVSGKLFKIPYNSTDSTYKDYWLYENGKIMSERIYQKTKGLVKETWFYKNGNKSSMREINNAYSIITHWSIDQKISSLNLAQNFSFRLELDTNDIKFNRCKDCIVQTTYDKNDNHVSTTWIDKNGNVRCFTGNGVTVLYDTEGIVKSIEYWNKERKLKLIKLE